MQTFVYLFLLIIKHLLFLFCVLFLFDWNTLWILHSWNVFSSWVSAGSFNLMQFDGCWTITRWTCRGSSQFTQKPWKRQPSTMWCSIQLTRSFVVLWYCCTVESIIRWVTLDHWNEWRSLLDLIDRRKH